MTTKEALQYIAEVEKSAEAAESMDDNSTIRVEQVDVCMPYITLYYYVDNTNIPPSYNQIQGILETQDSPLRVNYSRAFQDNRIGIHYYFVVDTTLGQGYLSDIKDMLNDVQDWMKDGDELTVYIVGDTAVRLIDSVDSEENIETEIQSISVSYNGMNYAEALDEIWTDMQNDKSVAEATTQGRRILITLTPEEEWTGNSVCEQKVISSLRQSGLPLYEMILGKEEPENAYHSLAEETGGTLCYPEKGKVGSQIEELCRQINRCYVVQFQADNNRVTNSWQSLSMKIDGEEETQVSIWMEKYQKDEEAPVINQAEVTSDQMIHLTFSEMVYGADENSHYQIIDAKGRELLIEELNCEMDEDGECNGVDILVSQKLYKGSYTISTTGIVDVSMEENVLTDDYVMEYADGPGEMIWVLDQCKAYWWMGIILIFIVGVAVVWKRTFRKQQNQKVAVQVHNAKAMLGQKEEGLQPAGYRRIKLIIYRNGKNIDTRQVEVDGSLIVGRSDLSDLYFENDQLSRQHFAIECIQGEMFVEDLDTTNGTWLNGKRIQKKEKLCSQDRIVAGMLEFVVRW